MPLFLFSQENVPVKYDSLITLRFDNVVVFNKKKVGVYNTKEEGFTVPMTKGIGFVYHNFNRWDGLIIKAKKWTKTFLLGDDEIAEFPSSSSYRDVFVLYDKENDTLKIERFLFPSYKFSEAMIFQGYLSRRNYLVKTIWVGIDSYVIGDATKPLNFDSLMAIEPTMALDYAYYKNRYLETDLMYKITDNRGDGFDSLYGTRNMRPILHGAAYRGGANNYYHNTDKRKNQNPLPLDGLSGLCKEGFSASVYLYRNNFEDYVSVDTCDCVDGSYNQLDYYQYDYFDSSHVREMVRMTHEAIVNPEVGPVYLHCWNG